MIWAALVGKAGGLGHRPGAQLLGRPVSTVRDWLARFASRAELVRGIGADTQERLITWAATELLPSLRAS